MTPPHPSIPPLPQPSQPAQATRALADAAHAAAGAWTQPLNPRCHDRAVSQLSSVLRDAGIATRRLADWQPDSRLPRPAEREFTRHLTAAGVCLLTAWNNLDGVPTAGETGRLPDPDEPGAALCRAARSTVRAWREPTGTLPDRDAAVRRLITATGFLSAGTLGLATYAPPGRAAGLQAVCACLAEAAANLAAAVHDAGSSPRPSA